jgi:Leucine-rich repeat (LRR) protein
LRELKNLRWLELDRCGLDDACLSSLSSLTVENLDLSGNPITDVTLIQLQKLSILEYLTVHDTQISLSGLRDYRASHPKVLLKSDFD